MRPPWAALYLSHETTVFIIKRLKQDSTSKMELFLIWQLPCFKIFYKDLHLRCWKRPWSVSHYRHFCFAQLDLNQFEANFYRWILTSLRPIFTLYRNRSINSNGKEDGWLLWDGNILISNSLRKQMCTCKVLTFN